MPNASTIKKKHWCKRCSNWYQKVDELDLYGEKRQNLNPYDTEEEDNKEDDDPFLFAKPSSHRQKQPERQKVKKNNIKKNKSKSSKSFLSFRPLRSRTRIINRIFAPGEIATELPMWVDELVKHGPVPNRTGTSEMNTE